MGPHIRAHVQWLFQAQVSAVQGIQGNFAMEFDGCLESEADRISDDPRAVWYWRRNTNGGPD